MRTETMGPQGGDLRHLGAGEWIDMSTCVNGYGPPPAVAAVLAAVGPDRIRAHPYDVADRLAVAYAAHLGVPPASLVVGRGTTEFIWTCRRLFDPRRVGVPMPAYTDFLRAFPAGPLPHRGRDDPLTLLEVEQAMAVCDAVVISNPSNPTGTLLPPAGLVQVCRAHARCQLVVDESYADFWPDPAGATVIGANVRNLLVLRSPSKFFGIAGARAGVAWSNDGAIRGALEAERGPWPISQLDGDVAVAALDSGSWEHEVRRRLVADGAWLDRLLRSLDSGPVEASRLHYRLWRPREAERIADTLQAQGIVTRLLGAAHGFTRPVIRLAAPTAQRRAQVATAFASLAGLLTEDAGSATALHARSLPH